MNYPKRQALVIGINEYLYLKPDLKSAVNDAEAIATILEAQGNFQVKRMPSYQDENNRVRVHPTLARNLRGFKNLEGFAPKIFLNVYSVSRLNEGQPPPTPPYQGGESPRLNKEGARGWLYPTQTGNAI